MPLIGNRNGEVVKSRERVMATKKGGAEGRNLNSAGNNRQLIKLIA